MRELTEGQLKNFAAQVRQISRAARTEEDFKIEFEKLLHSFLAEAGWEIPLQAEHERSLLGGGLADAVFGRVVIEYEKPGKLSDSNEAPGNRESIAQLRKYLTALAGERAAERETALRRLAGVSLDGQRIILMRGHDLASIGPFPIDVNSMWQFFLHLRALARKPLVPDELVSDFGPGAPFAQEAVNTLFAKVVGPYQSQAGGHARRVGAGLRHRLRPGAEEGRGGGQAPGEALQQLDSGS